MRLRFSNSFAVMIFFMATCDSLCAQSHPATAPADAEPFQSVGNELNLVINEIVATTPHETPSTNQAEAISANNETKRARLRTEADFFLNAPLPPQNLFSRQPFDDGSNRAFADKTTNILKEFNSKPPDVTKYLLDQDRRQPLRGTRLELLCRLLSGQVAIIAKEVVSPHN